ncbi:MAG: hypothetical protein MUF74_05320 [Cypionkella sp.]|nr:hypothetical protein [Cypionkella sp.]
MFPLPVTPRRCGQTIAVTALLALLPASLGAVEAPLTGADFEAYVTGKTITFASDGESYGTEQYLPGRRVVWAFTAEICREGIWHEEDGQICFVYTHDPMPQCWVFWLDGGLNARFTGGGEATELQEVAQSPDPLPCPGPQIGV